MSSIGSVSGDPTLELALLMLENAERLGELDRQRLQNARQAMERASAAEVAALHDAADAVATGALVQGGMTFASGAISCGAILNGAGATQLANAGGTEPKSPEMNALLRTGNGIGELADPMGKLAGEVPRRHAEARAAMARQLREIAGFDAEEARNSAQANERQADTVIDRAGQILDTEAQGNLAVLGNF
jgi:hypothetical protein